MTPSCASHSSSGSSSRRPVGTAGDAPSTSSRKSAWLSSRDSLDSAENGLAADPGRMATVTNSAPNAWYSANASTAGQHHPAQPRRQVAALRQHRAGGRAPARG